MTSNLNNYVVTATGTTPQLQGEGNLTFNGNVLAILGEINFKVSSMGTADGLGETVYFGNGTSLTAGDIYVLDSTNTWQPAHGDNLGTYSTGPLGVALGTSISNGMLIRGFARFTANSNYTGMSTIGDPLYLTNTIASGNFSQTPPGNSGEMVRIVGYVSSTGSDIMWFDPDPTWVEIA